jgi:hypothetical protein
MRPNETICAVVAGACFLAMALVARWLVTL